jgi:hypothetical protein
MAEITERREFSRYIIEFDIEVNGIGSDDKPFTETTVLHNISGGGAKFDTVMMDRYTAGLELTVFVNLPRTDEVNARMGGKATVMSVDYSDAPGSTSSQQASVTVRFESSLTIAKLP